MASKSGDQLSSTAQKLRSRLLKSVQQISLRYKMLEPNDKIMVCVSGGKDSATLLHLLMHLQTKLSSIGTNFQVVAVHLNQMQPGYDGTAIVDKFPILPCNLCGSQDDLHRGKAKLLVDAMSTMNPDARRNVINALGNIKPTHLLDENLRGACDLDRITGSVVDEERSLLIGERKFDASKDDVGASVRHEREKTIGVEVHNPSSFIESLL